MWRGKPKNIYYLTLYIKSMGSLCYKASDYVRIHTHTHTHTLLKLNRKTEKASHILSQ